MIGLSCLLALFFNFIWNIGKLCGQIWICCWWENAL